MAASNRKTAKAPKAKAKAPAAKGAKDSKDSKGAKDSKDSKGAKDSKAGADDVRVEVFDVVFVKLGAQDMEAAPAEADPRPDPAFVKTPVADKPPRGIQVKRLVLALSSYALPAGAFTVDDPVFNAKSRSYDYAVTFYDRDVSRMKPGDLVKAASENFTLHVHRDGDSPAALSCRFDKCVGGLSFRYPPRALAELEARLRREAFARGLTRKAGRTPHAAQGAGKPGVKHGKA